jgi:hypothetical protein
MKWKGSIRWAIAYGMAAFSAASAATYGAENASTAWKAVLAGGGLFLCAIVAVHCMAWAAEAWRRASRGWSICIGVGGLVCFAVTLASSTGMWASRADKIVATNAAAIDSGKALRAERDRLTAERVALTRRPAGAIEADISTAEAHPRFKSSASCAPDKITLAKEHCEGYRRLVGELAGAKRAEAIDARLATVNTAIGALPAVKSADAQASAIADLLSVSPDQAASVFAFGTSLALELGALIATLAAEVLGDGQRKPAVQRARSRRRVWHKAAQAAVISPPTAPALEPLPVSAPARLPVDIGIPISTAVVPFPPAAERVARLGGARVGRVGHFLLAAVMPSHGARLDARDLLEAYKAWCAVRNLRAVPDDEFALSLADACTKAGIECAPLGNTIVLMHAKLVA